MTKPGRMTELAERTQRAWLRAAEDLQFQWVPQFVRMTPDARGLSYLGLAKHFGAPGGAMVRIMQLGEFPGLTAWDENYVVAKIGDQFADYDRRLWQETLSKWGWEGPAEKRPDWLRVG